MIYAETKAEIASAPHDVPAQMAAEVQGGG